MGEAQRTATKCWPSEGGFNQSMCGLALAEYSRTLHNARFHGIEGKRENAGRRGVVRDGAASNRVRVNLRAASFFCTPPSTLTLPWQIYNSTLWPSFTFLELTEFCRQNRSQIRFSGIGTSLARCNTSTFQPQTVTSLLFHSACAQCTQSFYRACASEASTSRPVIGSSKQAGRVGKIEITMG